MRVEKISKKGRLYDGGNECLRYAVEIPRLEGCERINSFYEKIAEECELFCKEKLFEKLAGKRSESGRYELSFFVTHNDGEAVSMAFCVSLRCGRENISERFFAMTWSLSDEQMLPPRILQRRFGEKKKKINSKNALFLKNGVLKSLENGEEINFLLKSMKKSVKT